MSKKIAESVRCFLDYSFHGDGKYYTTEAGSRHYRNTSFGNFARLNPDCLKIIESGNDAPRGGRTGDFDIVEFTPIFEDRFRWYFEEKKEKENAERIRKENLKKEIEALGDQAEHLRKYFSERPGKSAFWDAKTEDMPSSKWRNWLKMKAASKVANNRFDLLTLSAPEILDIVREFI